MKNTTTKQRLKNYATLAGAALVVAQQANADIVYTDIFPDNTNNGGSFDIDMNNDGTDDFRLDMFLASSYNMYIYNLNANNGVFASTGGSAYAMNMSSAINASLTFDTGSRIDMANGSFFTYATGSGNWAGVTDGYLGVRFMIGTNTHYGWIRLSVNGAVNSFTVKDYAFENTPNTTILAGYRGFASLTEEELAGKLHLATEGNNVTIGISDPQLLNDAEVSLLTPEGKTLSSFPLNSEEQTVAVKEKGILIVRIRVQDAVLNRKIYVTGN